MKIYAKTEESLNKLKELLPTELNDIEQLNDWKWYSFEHHRNDIKNNNIFKKILDYVDSMFANKIKDILTKYELNIIKYSEYNYFYLYELLYSIKNDKNKLNILNILTSYNTSQIKRY